MQFKVSICVCMQVLVFQCSSEWEFFTFLELHVWLDSIRILWRICSSAKKPGHIHPTADVEKHMSASGQWQPPPLRPLNDPSILPMFVCSQISVVATHFNSPGSNKHTKWDEDNRRSSSMSCSSLLRNPSPTRSHASKGWLGHSGTTTTHTHTHIQEALRVASSGREQDD